MLAGGITMLLTDRSLNTVLLDHSHMVKEYSVVVDDVLALVLLD